MTNSDLLVWLMVNKWHRSVMNADVAIILCTVFRHCLKYAQKIALHCCDVCSNKNQLRIVLLITFMLWVYQLDQWH